MTEKIISLNGLKKNNAIIETQMKYQKLFDTSNARIINLNVVSNSVFSISKVIFGDGVSSCGVTIFNKNIVDVKDSNNIREGYILNDSGVETADSNGNYTIYKTPVIPGETLYINWGVQRIYYYDQNGDFLGRTATFGNVMTTAFGAFLVPDNVYFIQIQFFHNVGSGDYSYNFDQAQIERGTSATAYVLPKKKYFYTTQENVNVSVCFEGEKISIFRTTNSVIGYYYYLLPQYNILDLLGAKQKTKTVTRIYDISYGKKDATIEIDSYTSYGYSIQCRGKNIFNKGTLISGKIKTDSGQEINDSSSYFADMVPVIPGEKLTFNFGVQRIYQYGIDGTWIRRTGTLTPAEPLGTWTVPSDVYFIQIQIAAITYNVDFAQIEVGETETDYEPFVSSEVVIFEDKLTPINSLIMCNDGFNRVYCTSGNQTYDIKYIVEEDDGSSLGVAEIPQCSSVSVWRPDFITDEYKQPIGRQNVTLSMTLDTFLSTFFDVYLGTNEDGYRVNKKSIGHDASHRYEIYEYDFIPKNYNRVIMLSAGMNPCELPAEFGLAYLMHFIMNNHEDDAGLKYLYENVRIKVMPCINANKFDTTPKGYANYHDIRINKNFNFKTSWDSMDSGQNKGTFPDSEEEVWALKKWLNENANYAELWIDCHTDPDANTPTNIWVATSDSSTSSGASNAINSIITYYHSLGLDTGNQLANHAHVTGLTAYPKTLYAKQVCNIPAMQIEMWSNTTALGGSAEYMNDSADIQFYVCFLRQLIMNQLVRGEQTKVISNMELYQSIKKTNGIK